VETNTCVITNIPGIILLYISKSRQNMLNFRLKQLSEKIKKYCCMCPAVKAHRDSRGADRAALSTLCSGRRYPEKTPVVHKIAGLRGPQSLSVCCEEDESLLHLRGCRICIVQLAA